MTSNWTVVDSACEGSGDGPNEDLVGASGSVAWLLDGATPIGKHRSLPGASDAAHFVHAVDEALTTLASKPIRDARTFLRSAIKLTAEHLAADRLRDWDIPPAASAAVAILRERHIEVLLLGDVSVICNGDSTPSVLVDSRFLDKERAAARDARQTVGDLFTRHDESVVEAMTTRRFDYIAGRDDMWILSTNPAAARGARHVILDRSPDAMVLLFSDGYGRAVVPYELYPNWGSLYRASLSSSCASVVAHIRNHEARHIGTDFFKTADDAAAMVLSGNNI